MFDNLITKKGYSLFCITLFGDNTANTANRENIWKTVKSVPITRFPSIKI